ncbi:MAG: DinB family protein [Dehalococcoidia bacterium]
MRWIPVLALLAFGASGLAAQTGPVAPRDVQRRQLEWQKNTMLQMVEAMPENLYSDKATPEQRSFAEQILHAAGFAPMVCGQFIAGTVASLPDAEAAGASTASMAGYITAAYDFCLEALAGQSDADRQTIIEFFGMMSIPKAETLDHVYRHTTWTLGQVVANFRKHGMAPPEFGFF